MGYVVAMHMVECTENWSFAGIPLGDFALQQRCDEVQQDAQAMTLHNILQALSLVNVLY